MAGFAPAALGQLPATRLLTMTPPGGKSGASVEVTISGSDLDDLKELRFSHSNITATVKGTNRFEVTVDRAVPPGIYDAWAVGKYGASNPRAFAVGVLAEVAKGPASADHPQTVTLESVINGRTEASAADYFQFHAKQGQRVLVRCAARALDSKLEPVLALTDSTGREVERSRSGGLLDYTAPAGGEFTVRLHDATYRGGAEFFYRLSVGTFPHIDQVRPVAGGTKAKFAVLGRNLPGGQIVDPQAKPALERMEVELAENDPGVTRPLTTMPAQAGLELFEYRAHNERGVSDAALLRFPTAPVIAEQEPNNTPVTPQKITVPCEVAGQFHANGDRDWFSFEAKKGDVYWLEVISHRLGWPTDPLLIVQRPGANGATDVLELNDSDANVGGAEFNTTHRDPSGRFEIKEDGTYLLQVRDLFTRPSREAAPDYQLIIRKPAPEFQLAALPATPLPANKDAKNVPVSTTSLRRDETLPIKVFALRRDGFDGAIELSTEQLPPGIAASPARIEAGKSSALVFLRATGEVAAVTASVTIRGTASLGGTNLTRTARPANLLWSVADPANDALLSRRSSEYLVSTVDEAPPLRLTAVEEKTWEAVAGGKIKIPLKLEREGEVTATLKMKPVGVAGLESAKEFDLDPKATNVVYEIDLGQQKLAPGTYVFSLQGVATGKPMKAGKGGKKTPGKDAAFTLYSAPITLKVSPAPVAATNAPAK